MSSHQQFESLKLEALPFLWHPLEDPTTNPFPATLPFELYQDAVSGIVSQVPDPAVQEVLAASYGKGTYFEGLMDATGIGAEYAQDFVKFIDMSISSTGTTTHSALEIGCGTGYLLSLLQEKGMEVLGYEPGFAAIGRFPVPVEPAFFPSPAIAGRTFDLIAAFALVEHIPDPRDLLRAIARYLTPQGVAVLAVPDCEDQIGNGDLSMLIHEHFSYFTLETFSRLVESAGFETIEVRKSGFGGMIYGAFRRASSPPTRLPVAADDLLGRVAAAHARLREYLERHEGKEIGVYVPGRAVNSLYTLRDEIKTADITLRFFDDSDYLQGRFFPGFATVVESRAELIASPPDALLIYSYSFADRIIANLGTSLEGSVEVTRLADLLDGRA